MLDTNKGHCVLRVYRDFNGQLRYPCREEREQALTANERADNIVFEDWAAPENPLELYPKLRERLCASDKPSVLMVELDTLDQALIAAFGAAIQLGILTIRTFMPIFGSTMKGSYYIDVHVPDPGNAKLIGFAEIRGASALAEDIKLR